MTKLCYYFLLFICFSNGLYLAGQDTINCPFEIELYQPGILNNAKAFDFDLDGQLEQISFNGTTDKVFLKDLEGGLGTISQLDNSWTTSIFPGFLDDDKFPDLVFCNDHVSYYLYGNGKFKTKRQLTTKKINGRSMQSIFIIDIDNDNDGDVLIHYEGLGLYLIYNNSGVFDWQNMTKIFANNYGGRGFGETCDINNDGWMDLIFYNPYAGLYALMNTQSNSFSVQRLSDTWNPCGFGIGDIDNDGFVDLVQGYTSQNTSSISIEVFKNNQDGRFERKHSVTGMNRPGAFSIADLNDDGHNELIVGDGNKLFAFQISSDFQLYNLQQLSEENLNTDPNNITFGMITCDRDNDGDLDFVVKSLSSSASTEFYMQCSGVYNRTCDPYLLDLDNDGYSFADCDDNNDQIYPGAEEIFGNNVDEDCDGVASLVSPDYPLYAITKLKENNPTGFNILLNKKVSVSGVITTQNFSDDDAFFAIAESSGEGVWVLNESNALNLSPILGDSVLLYGTVELLGGMTIVDLDGIFNFGQVNTEPVFKEIDFVKEGEEGSLLRISNVSFVDNSQWLGDGSSFDVEMTDGFYTHVIHIDEQSELSRMVLTGDIFNITGIGFQEDFSYPYLDGFALFPRDFNDLEITSTNQHIELEKNVFHIYPTHTIDEVYITIKDKNHSLYNTAVYNMDGQLLLSSKKDNLSLGFLNDGVYVISVQSNKGHVQVFRIIKTS